MNLYETQETSGSDSPAPLEQIQQEENQRLGRLNKVLTEVLGRITTYKELDELDNLLQLWRTRVHFVAALKEFKELEEEEQEV